MPTYSYYCNSCKKAFELFNYIKDYQESPKCTECESCETIRLFTMDVETQFASVKKSNSELKTIGDLAKRNADKMSEDQKQDLYQKHNAYKDDKFETNPLPKGMSYKKKPSKPIWPNSTSRKRRSRNK